MMNESFFMLIFPIFVVAYYSLTAAVMAAPLALIVLVVDSTVGKRMAPRFRCLLWLLVVARLVMPIAPESSLSVHNLWDFITPEEQIGTDHVVSDIPDAYPAPAMESQTISEFMSAPTAVAAPAPPVPAAGLPWEEIIAWSLLLLWFAGVVVLLLRSIIASVRFAKQLASIPRVEDQHIVNMLLHVCHELAVRHCPQVQYVPGLPTPALFGLFRPTLCLPEETRSSLSDNQLRMIMIHEVMHLRRRDTHLSWLLTVVQAVHWFNPIAWFVMGKVATYRELACDAAVRKFTAPEERHAYTDLLLQFASQRSTASLGLVGLWFARPVRGLTARIKTFDNADENQHRFPRLTFGIVFGLLAIVGLTNAASTDIENKPPSQHASTFSNEFVRKAFDAYEKNDEAHIPEGLIEERAYDITLALENLTEVNPDGDAYQCLLTYLKLPGLEPLSVRRGDDSPNQLSVMMSQRGHERFANILDGISRSGPWQICIEMREFRINNLEAIKGINWQDAVKFAVPAPTNSSAWATDNKPEDGRNLSLSVESVSFEYAPYLALVINQEMKHQIVNQSIGNPDASVINAPKITVFNGQQAYIRDESLSPFVVGVHYVKGEQATAAQPDITVLSQGVKMDVRPLVVDKDAVDLQCRLTLSHIDGVRNLTLPGQEITIQVPRASRKTISAHCRLKVGQTLMLAPTVNSEGKDSQLLYYTITPQWFPDTLSL